MSSESLADAAASSLLVSVHIPKCGGSTLLRILVSRYGDRLQRAYQPPKPGLAKTETDGWPDIENPACIHGHAIDRYLPLIRARPGVRWITFLRDPLAGAISFYHHLERHAPWDPSAPPAQPTTSLEADLLQRYNHNRYSKWFARLGQTVDTFALIGLTERFDESIEALRTLMSWPPVPYTAAGQGNYAPPIIDPAVAAEFRRLNASDYDVYQKATARLRALK